MSSSPVNPRSQPRRKPLPRRRLSTTKCFNRGNLQPLQAPWKSRKRLSHQQRLSIRARCSNSRTLRDNPRRSPPILLRAQSLERLTALSSTTLVQLKLSWPTTSFQSRSLPLWCVELRHHWNRRRPRVNRLKRHFTKKWWHLC